MGMPNPVARLVLAGAAAVCAAALGLAQMWLMHAVGAFLPPIDHTAFRDTGVANQENEVRWLVASGVLLGALAAVAMWNRWRGAATSGVGDEGPAETTDLGVLTPMDRIVVAVAAVVGGAAMGPYALSLTRESNWSLRVPASDTWIPVVDAGHGTAWGLALGGVAVVFLIGRRELRRGIAVWLAAVSFVACFAALGALLRVPAEGNTADVSNWTPRELARLTELLLLASLLALSGVLAWWAARRRERFAVPAAISGPLLLLACNLVNRHERSDHYEPANDVGPWFLVVALSGMVATVAWQVARRERPDRPAPWVLARRLVTLTSGGPTAGPLCVAAGGNLAVFGCVAYGFAFPEFAVYAVVLGGVAVAAGVAGSYGMRLRSYTGPVAVVISGPLLWAVSWIPALDDGSSAVVGELGAAGAVVLWTCWTAIVAGGAALAGRPALFAVFGALYALFPLAYLTLLGLVAGFGGHVEVYAMAAPAALPAALFAAAAIQVLRHRAANAGPRADPRAAAANPGRN